MRTFTLKDPFALGERDEKFGQTWYSQTHDSDKPVMFNLMDGEVHDGEVITAETVELAEFKSGKNAGKEYMRLRKVRTQGATASTKPSAPVQTSTKKDWRDDSHIRAQWAIGQAIQHLGKKESSLEDVERLARALFEMVDRVKSGSVNSGSQGDGHLTSETKAEKSEPAASPLDNVDYDIGDEPINLDDIPF